MALRVTTSNKPACRPGRRRRRSSHLSTAAGNRLQTRTDRRSSARRIERNGQISPTAVEPPPAGNTTAQTAMIAEAADNLRHLKGAPTAADGDRITRSHRSRVARTAQSLRAGTHQRPPERANSTPMTCDNPQEMAASSESEVIARQQLESLGARIARLEARLAEVDPVIARLEGAAWTDSALDAGDLTALGCRLRGNATQRRTRRGFVTRQRAGTATARGRQEAELIACDLRHKRPTQTQRAFHRDARVFLWPPSSVQRIFRRLKAEHGTHAGSAMPLQARGVIELASWETSRAATFAAHGAGG